ncbi:MAG: hypothetical protein ABIL25_04755 [candidate division WOR-3 bacterium]
MRTSSVLALVAGCALLLTGCDLFGPKEVNYFPLGVGSTWQYLMLDIRVYPDSTDTLAQDTISIEAKAETQLTSGEKAVLMEVKESGSVDSVYYRTTDDFVLFYEDLDDDEPDTIIKFPLEPDNIWHLDEDILVRVVGQETKTVVAGTYKNCWKLRQTEDGELLLDMWFAPNIGLCLAELDEEYQGIHYIERLELNSVRIK